MNVRTIGDLALAGSLLTVGAFAWRDTRRKGFRKTLFEGTVMRPGSVEDRLATGAAIGVAVFLLTRLAPGDGQG